MAPSRPAGQVAAALADDLDAGFVGFYDAYRRVAFTTALRVSGRWADAEDLTAEAFLRAYRALRGYDRDRIRDLQPRAWLLTILLNAWRNLQRTRARHVAEEPLTDVDPADPSDGVETLAERDETRHELAVLLLHLPEVQRIAVVLRHVNDLPIAEIAAVLDCPEGTAKSHISRGMRRLRELNPAPQEMSR
jgi:RNA polymerase sigma-70 factor (ECF subfamily)